MVQKHAGNLLKAPVRGRGRPRAFEAETALSEGLGLTIESFRAAGLATAGSSA